MRTCGASSPYAKYPGELSLGTPGTLPAVRARTPSNVLACTINPLFTDKLESELDVRPTVSLHEQPGIQDHGLHQLLLLLAAESEAQGACGKLYVDSLFHALVTRFLYLSRAEKPLNAPRSNALPRHLLLRVIDRMNSDFRSDLDLATLAADSGYSRAHFLRMFRTATGKTPHQYLLDIRLDFARGRLKETSASLADVALASGFSSHSHLTRAFLQRFGVPPSQYRRND